MVRELAELDPAREMARHCVRTMAIGLSASLVAAFLLIVGAVVVILVVKRLAHKKKREGNGNWTKLCVFKG
jgi:hypothetical protein